MTVQTITLIVSLISIASVLSKIVFDYAQLKTWVKSIEKRMDEDRHNNSRKFTELFESRNENKENIVKISTILESLVDKMTSIESKVDELRERLRER